MEQDFKDLLKAFSDEKVEYLVVGGYAVARYTEPRYTKDLDLWVRPDEANAIAAEDLVINKEAAGRYQDLADAEKLGLTLDRPPGARGGKTKR